MQTRKYSRKNTQRGVVMGIKLSLASRLVGFLICGIFLVNSNPLFSSPAFAEDTKQPQFIIKEQANILEFSPSVQKKGKDRLHLLSLGGGDGVRIENISPSRIEVKPQQIITTTFRVINETGATHEFTPTLDLPDGWKVVLSVSPFILKSGEEKNVNLSICLPMETLAGDYSIILGIHAADSKKITGNAIVDVSVIAMAKVVVIASSSEYRTITGEMVTKTFTVKNNSNSASRFEIETISYPSWPTIIDPQTFSLEIGESKTIFVALQTPNQIPFEEQHKLTLVAHALDLEHGSVKVKAVSKTLVYPRILKGNMYETLEGDISFLRSWSNKNAGLAGQYKVDLSGDLGKGRWSKIKYIGHYPFEWRNYRFTQEDYFLMQYGEMEKYFLSVGESSFRVSELVEPNYYGRGAEIKVVKAPYTMRLFTAKRSAGMPSERLSGTQISMDANENSEFTLSYIKRDEINVPAFLNRENQKGNMLTLAGKTETANGIQLKGEYGIGKLDTGEGLGSKTGSGYMVSAKIDGDIVGFNGKVIRSGKNFPGYWKNSNSAQANMKIKLSDKVNIWSSYNKTRRNPYIDPTQSNNNNRYFDIGMNYSTGRNGNFRIYERWITRKDTNRYRWNKKDRTTNVRLSHSFNNISITGSAEFGKRKNVDMGISEFASEQSSLMDIEKDIQKYQIVFHTRPNENSSISTGYSWNTEETILTDQYQVNDRFWVDADFKINKRVDFEAKYSRANGTNRSIIDWFQTEIEYVYADGRTFQIAAMHHRGISGKNTEVSFMFTFPLRIPLPWIAKYGQVKGRVYLEDSLAPLSDVVIRVNGMKVATGQDGRFVFPTIEEGDYQLEIERSTLDFGLIPALQLPYDFAITPGKTINIELPIVYASNVRGNISLQSIGNGDSSAGSDEQTTTTIEDANLALQTFLVILTDGISEYSAYIKADEAFNFTDLRPGSYKLYMVDGQISQNYELTPAEFKIEISPNDKLDNMVFKISPVKRDILITVKEEE